MARIESAAHCSRAAEERPSRKRESGSEAAAEDGGMRRTFGNAERSRTGRARTGRSARQGRKPEPTPLFRTGPADLEAFGRRADRERDGRRSSLRSNVPIGSSGGACFSRVPEGKGSRSLLRKGRPGKPRELASEGTRKGPGGVRSARQPWDLSKGAFERRTRNPKGNRPGPKGLGRNPLQSFDAKPRGWARCDGQWGSAAMPAPISFEAAGDTHGWSTTAGRVDRSRAAVPHPADL